MKRRAFIASSAATLGACASAGIDPHSIPTPATEPALPPDAGARLAVAAEGGITAATIEEAEKLVGLKLTPEQRALVVADFQPGEDAAAMVAALHKHSFPNELGPATTFALAPPVAPRGGTAFKPTKAAPGPAPKSDEDLAFASLASLSRWIRDRAVTSVKLTELALERLARIGPKLECVVTLLRDRALEQARAADAETAAGKIRGPLHGIPWGAKDLLDTAGIATTWGAGPYRDRVPAKDAAVVTRLAAAGAVLVAKLSMGELAYGDVWFGGRTRNPWNPAEGSGGSSAGPAAAVAAGLVPFAIGSETEGSIIMPSHRCGGAGLRPTFGRVPRTGAMVLCWSMDKLGPMARSAEDALVVLQTIHGPDGVDGACVAAPLGFDAAADVKGVRVGWVRAWFDDPKVPAEQRAVLDAAKDLGLGLVPIELPKLPYDALNLILYAESAAAFDDLVRSGRVDELVLRHRTAWPNALRESHFLSAVDLVQADRLRRQTAEVMRRIFEGVDVILGPERAGPMGIVTNLTGHPALALRAGFVERGPRGFVPAPPEEYKKEQPGPRSMVPTGVTLWGRLFDEGTLVRVGSALEKKLGVAGRRPPVG